MKTMKREVNQELWFYIMTESYNGDEAFENDTFQIIPYQWTDDNTYNFYHKSSGLKVAWYKYPLRAATSNMEITPEQFRAVLYDCMNSIHPNCIVMIKKWWESEQEKQK